MAALAYSVTLTAVRPGERRVAGEPNGTSSSAPTADLPGQA
jgi:hypothetical protein